ncbi:MAG: YitT family protein [Fusobacteriota bacterium]
MKHKTKIGEYILINFGLIILALGLVLFLIPGKIAAGGVSGLATVVYNVWGFPPGIFMFLCNIPLFIIGFKIFGKSYGFKTFYGSLMVSVYTVFFSRTIGLEGVTNNTLLAALYGGIFAGIGVGVLMKLGGSTGGTDIIAQIIHKYLKIQIGYAMITVDSFVLGTAAFVFGFEPALYAVISLYASGRVINLIFNGMDYSRVAYIITDKHEEVKQLILEELQHGGTVIPSKGLYTNDDKNIIMTVVRNRSIFRLKDRIENIDENAFMIITEAHEVLGEGFKPLVKERNG